MALHRPVGCGAGGALNMPSVQNTVPAVITEGAHRWPDKTFITDDAESFTYAETLRRTRRMAAGLKALGIEAGEKVLVMMDSHCDFSLAWFSINYIGATMVTVNTAYKGGPLRNVIENSEAAVLIIEAKYLDRVSAAVPDWRPRRLIIRGCDQGRPEGGQSSLRLEDVAADAPEDLVPTAQVSDAAAIIYTSGTTGLSKGVVVPHGLMISYADPRYLPQAVESDVVPVVYPMYYVGGLEVVLNAALVGATAVIFPRFSASRFWESAAKCGATYVPLNGAMANFIHRQPPGSYDRAHKVRRMRLAPVLKDVEAFKERFGVAEISTVYGMTESSVVVCAPFGRTTPGAIGWARPDYDVRIFNAQDEEVPDGEIGEIVVRPKKPWSVMLGYNRNPEATAAMWRNLWLHTGDLGRRNPDGELFFIDRVKDSLRRRGENVSSQEVESYIYQYAAVLECAVVAAPDEASEGDEIKAFITLKEGHGFDFFDFIAFLADRMPSFWVPRYVEVVDDMPRSPNGRIRKQALKSAPQGERAWDREREGIVLQR
jgi:crotonobetaine/carnitine-CoA ligase